MTWINRILVPLDMSPCSIAALQYAAFLGEHSGAQLYVVHALEPTAADPAEQGEPAAAIRAILAATPFVAARSAQVQIVAGEASRVILEAARALAVDLIVMGKYGDGARSVSLCGNVTAQVSAGSACAVVPIHEPATRGTGFVLAALAANDSTRAPRPLASIEAPSPALGVRTRKAPRAKKTPDDLIPRIGH